MNTNVSMRPAEPRRPRKDDMETISDWAANQDPAESARRARWHPRRVFLYTAGGLLLLLALVPLALWGHMQATHVVTRNALVRSHLSELGVRGEGVVSEVLVMAGDTVREGDLLARLEDGHLLAQRAQAEAALGTLAERIALERASLLYAQRESQVNLAQFEAEYRRVQAQAVAAQVRADDARAFSEARDSLGADGAVSAEMIRHAAAQAATQGSLATAAAAAEAGARAERDAAVLALEAVALREAQLRVLMAQHREAQAELARVEADIRSTRVLAPADGAVIRRLAQPGMAVETGTPLVSMWLSDDTWVEAWIPEKQLGDLHIGSDATVSFPALPGERFTGVVARIGLATDFEMPADYLPETRQARMRPTPQVGVKIHLDAPPALVRPGMSAIVDIHRDGD